MAAFFDNRIVTGKDRLISIAFLAVTGINAHSTPICVLGSQPQLVRLVRLMAASGVCSVGSQKPTSVYDSPWIWQDSPSSSGTTLGKWLIFKHVSKIDATWKEVSEAVASGELGATGAKVSTMRKSELATDENVKVICVYTTREDMDEVGLKLIRLTTVRQTIRYKTDEATRTGVYRNTGFKKSTIRALHWNSGKPYYTDQLELICTHVLLLSYFDSLFYCSHAWIVRSRMFETVVFSCYDVVFL